MKYSISSVILAIMAISTCMAQNELMVDSHYFTRSHGVDVYVNDSRIGQTPLTFPLTPGRKSTIDFRNQRGESVMKLNVHPEQVSNIRSLSATPSWYGSSSTHPAYPGYRLATTRADSRSLSISLNKAKTEAADQLARSRSGGRAATAGRRQNLPQSADSVQILECHIYFDGSGYRTYILAGIDI